jgi:hypothetical protein
VGNFSMNQNPITFNAIYMYIWTVGLYDADSIAALTLYHSLSGCVKPRKGAMIADES